MADIFVSYATEDRDRVKSVVGAIEKAGYSVWWDRKIGVGCSFDRVIEQELDSCACVLVIWSSTSIEKDWIRSEAQEGLDRGVLVPVLFDDAKPPLAFRRTQAAVLGRDPTDEELEPVLAAINSCLDRVSATPDQAESPPSRGALRTPSQNAIAVLPFQNLSSDPEQEFFSDGIAEDILNELSNGTDLMVRPRSSSFSLRGQSLDIPKIGELLNVTHVLDGTVRRAGRHVRVTVQLSEVRTNKSIWSGRYDRDLTDIFAVQDEITGKVLHALKSQLSGMRTPRQFVGTEAYNAFLRGRHHLAQGEFKLAQEWYETAIQLNPHNVDAMAGLSRILAMRGPRRDQSLHDHRIEMDAHLDRLLTIDPSHPQALAWTAERTFFRRRNYQSAIDQLVELVNANPSDEEAHRSLSWVLCAIGRAKLYLLTTRQMTRIAPLSREAMLNQIDAYLNIGNLSEARMAMQELSRLQIKVHPRCTAGLAIIDRDPDALQAVIDRYTAPEAWDRPFQRIWNKAMVPYLRGDFAQAREIIAERKQRRVTTVLQRHLIALIERDFDAALHHYGDALRLGYWFAYVGAHLNYQRRLVFPEFYENPRYNELLQKYGIDALSTERLRVPTLKFVA
jgi:adenylate cyclase